MTSSGTAVHRVHSFSTSAGVVEIHTFAHEQSSHLVVHQGQSVLVDCHDASLAAHIRAQHLPSPMAVLHTHIQPEHTRQGSTLGDIPTYVHHKLTVLAGDRDTYNRLTRTTWDDPMDWPNTAGQEAFGIAGSVTMLPPQEPLTHLAPFSPGQKMELIGLVFEVIPLPGHGGEHACGFLLHADRKPVALFTGDLLCHRAKLVNVYDLEYAYSRTRLFDLPAILRQVATLGVSHFFPATGQPLYDGPEQARELASNIEAYQQALSWKSGQFCYLPPAEPARLGRWYQHGEGLFQLSNFGNTIVLIDDDGRGLMIDPGPCDFGDDGRTRRFHKDLDQLHEHAGLREIDCILLTHFHGDHLDMVEQMRQRYPAVRVAAWEVLAEVIANPQDYAYPCMLPWYNLGGESSVKVDDRLSLDALYHWHDIAIEVFHLPGHCYVHSGFLLCFRGKQIAITGDTIQDRTQPAGLEYIIANDSVPDEHRGQLKGLKLLCQRQVDLNLGGHSSYFYQPRSFYEESIRRICYAQPYLKALVPDGDLHRAFHRPTLPLWSSCMHVD